MTGVIQRLWVRVPPESHFAAGARRSLLGLRGCIGPGGAAAAPGCCRQAESARPRESGRSILGAASRAARAPGGNPALPGRVLSHLSQHFRSYCYRLPARPRSTGTVELPLAHRGYILSKKSIFMWLVSALPKTPPAPSAAFFPQAPQVMAAGTGARDCYLIQPSRCRLKLHDVPFP